MRAVAIDAVAWSVCVSVVHVSEPCKNGLTDRDAVWGWLMWSNKPFSRWGQGQTRTNGFAAARLTRRRCDLSSIFFTNCYVVGVRDSWINFVVEYTIVAYNSNTNANVLHCFAIIYSCWKWAEFSRLMVPSNSNAERSVLRRPLYMPNRKQESTVPW